MGKDNLTGSTENASEQDEKLITPEEAMKSKHTLSRDAFEEQLTAGEEKVEWPTDGEKDAFNEGYNACLKAIKDNHVKGKLLAIDALKIIGVLVAAIILALAVVWIGNGGFSSSPQVNGMYTTSSVDGFAGVESGGYSGSSMSMSKSSIMAQSADVDSISEAYNDTQALESNSSSSGSVTDTWSATGSVDNSTEEKASNKIIYTGELRIRTKDVEGTVDNVLNEMNKSGGYIESMSTSKTEATLTVRVPADGFTAFMYNKEFADGNSISRSIRSKDVTLQYSDTESRIKSLQVRRDRLQSYMESATNVKDLLDIEDNLMDVIEDLEATEGTKKTLDSYITYSAVTVYISTTVIETEWDELSFGEKVKTQFENMIHGVKVGCENFVMFLINIIPLLVFLVIAAIIVVLIIKVRKRKKDKKND